MIMNGEKVRILKEAIVTSLKVEDGCLLGCCAVYSGRY
jgi:hypothetical protein